MNPAPCAVAIDAPATPQSTAPIITPAYRIRATSTPAVSAAAGCSPHARSRNPNRVCASTNAATGTSRKAPTVNTVCPATTGRNRASAGNIGVCPPCRNRNSANVAVSPEAMMLIAIPDTTWLPRSVTLATPCTSPNMHDAATAAANPAQADPVAAATAAAAKAPTNILPSSPTSITPPRSENSPANPANTNGVEVRKVADTIDSTRSINRSPP